MTASPGADADPVVAAVAEALCRPHHPHCTRYIDPDPSQRPRALATAAVAVEAHRRAVLDQRDDGERWAGAAESSEMWDASAAADVVRELLAALADAEIARRQAEAERDAAHARHDPGNVEGRPRP